MENWAINTETTTESTHFSFQDDYDNAEDYGVYGWHRWDQLAGKGSWYLVYRLHTTQNPGNVDKLGDRTLALWMGDNVYAPATYNTADSTKTVDVNQYSIFNYDSLDLASWMWTYQCYSRKEKKTFFYAWTHGKEIKITLENVVHFVPSYFGFFIGKDPWHRSFHGKIQNYYLVFGPGAYKTEGFDGLRAKRVTAFKALDSIAGNTYEQVFSEEKSILNVEFDISQLDSLEEYGVSFYYRWTQRGPIIARDTYHYLSQWFLLARFNENYGDNGYLGSRSVGAWVGGYNRDPGLYWATYDIASGATS